MGYRVVNGKIYAIEEMSPFQSKCTKNNISKNKSDTFKELLKSEVKKTEQFNISNHAAQRLKVRNINFDEHDMKVINEGINMAKEKGAKDSVIFYRNVALVTSITNRTVITALEKGKDKNIFTNIDSVILL